MLGFDIFSDSFLGISPGQASTAYAVVSRVEGDNKMTLLESGIITTDSSQPDPERLAFVHTELLRVVEMDTPSAVGIFDLGFISSRSHHQYRIAKVVGLVAAIAFDSELDIFMLDHRSKQADQQWKVLRTLGEKVSDKRLLNAIDAALICADLWQVRN